MLSLCNASFALDKDGGERDSKGGGSGSGGGALGQRRGCEGSLCNTPALGTFRVAGRTRPVTLVKRTGDVWSPWHGAKSDPVRAPCCSATRPHAKVTRVATAEKTMRRGVGWHGMQVSNESRLPARGGDAHKSSPATSWGTCRLARAPLVSVQFPHPTRIQSTTRKCSRRRRATRQYKICARAAHNGRRRPLRPLRRGKSTLLSGLKKLAAVTVISCDDFYLPKDQCRRFSVAALPWPGAVPAAFAERGDADMNVPGSVNWSGVLDAVSSAQSSEASNIVAS